MNTIELFKKELRDQKLSLNDVHSLHSTLEYILKEKCKRDNLLKTVKVVVNTGFGCFKIPTAILKELELESKYSFILRDNSILVNYVENNPNDPHCKDLAVITKILFPWENFQVNDYDGKEWVSISS